MSLPENMQHTHSGMGGDWPKIKARDLDWNWYSFPSGSNIFMFDLWWNSWWTWDNTYRNILFPCKDGDMQITYNTIVLEWQISSISAKWSMRYTTANYDGVKSITLKPWEIIEVTANLFSASSNLKVNHSWGSARFLHGSNNVLTQSNPHVSFVNASATDMTITFQYATSASDRPILGILCKIY